MRRSGLSELRVPLLAEAMEIMPVDPPQADLEDATIEDIESQKAALIAKREDLVPGIVLPATLRRCVEAMRTTCLCKVLVARNPRTKLNELHLLQPLMLLLLAGGLVLLPVTGLVLGNWHVPTAGGSMGMAALCAVSSMGLCVVGFIARAIPSHGDLNVQMDDQVNTLGGNVDGVERSSDAAAGLEKKMRLSWVSARRKTRDTTRALHAAYVEEVQLDARVQFKVKLLEYLSSGESLRATRQRQRVEAEFEANYAEVAKLYDNPLAELKRKKSVFAPNGRLSREELHEVAREVDQTETADHGAYTL